MLTSVETAGRAEPASRLTGFVLLAGAVLAGAGVAALGSRGTAVQAEIVLAVALAAPALLVFLFRPHAALAVYLFALPLVVPIPTALGLNAGEAVTIVVLGLGMLSLWDARGRLLATLRSLAWLLWPMTALIGVSLVSLIVNGLMSPADFVSALFKLVAFSFAAVLVHVHTHTPDRARALLRALVMGATAVAAYAVAAYLLGWSYSDEYDWNRPMGTLENWNLLGSYMALMSMPTLGLAATADRIWSRVLYGGGFLLQLTAMLLSLTLGSILGLLVGGALVVLFLMGRGWRRILPVALMMAVPAAVVLATNPVLRDKIANVDERVLDRLRTYAVGVAMFRDKVWLGFGTEQQVLEELRFGEADYGLTVFGASSSMAHNSFIQIGVEKGLFGALTFALVIFGALHLLLRDRRVFMSSRQAALYQATMVGVLAFLVQNLTNVLVLHARLGVLFFALVVLVERIGSQLRQREREAGTGMGAHGAAGNLIDVR